MQTNTISETTNCTLANEEAVAGSDTPKLSDRYIVVCPEFFDTVLKLKLERMDTYDVRDEKNKYMDSPDDRWSDECPKDSYFAAYYYSESSGERFVYFRAQGKLFSCSDIIEAAKILEELKAQEDLKVIKSPTV